MTFIKGHSTSFDINSSNVTTGYHRTLTSSLFLMILFTQTTAVLHKYLNDELIILCLLQFFPKVAHNSPSFPYSEKSLSIPGLWPPCTTTTTTTTATTTTITTTTTTTTATTTTLVLPIFV